MLGEVKHVPLDGLIFFSRPVATLTLKEAASTVSGYQLVDDDDHCWLEIGTDNYEDYYPCFTFRYDPPKTHVGCQKHDRLSRRCGDGATLPAGKRPVLHKRNDPAKRPVLNKYL
jgi:hypothetical protein